MEIFQNFLGEDEVILESFQPVESKYLTRNDIFLIPASIFFFGFSLFWEIYAIIILLATKAWDMIIMLIFGGIFVIIGFYFCIGRFFYKKALKRNTYFAITNKRVIKLKKSLFGGYECSAIFINTLNNLTIGNIDKNNIGTIRFNNTQFVNQLYENTGMDIFLQNNLYSFFDISNPFEKYKLIIKLKEDKK